MAEQIGVQVVEAQGARIPAIGLGTWDLRGKTCARVVEQALRLGYRHIDTAEMYENEAAVGEGLRASGIKRDDVFVTTKVWHANLAPRELEKSCKASLARLKLDYVDLYLIHWPNSRIPLSETIPALCKMQTAGFARHVGVSNFNAALVAEAAKLATVPLVNDQIDWNPFTDQSKVRASCKANGMSVTAYSPIAKGEIVGDTLLASIAMQHGKTAAQVALRFLVQEGAIVIPRTSKLERLQENADIFSFALDASEMDQIRKRAKAKNRTDWMGTEWT